ncbi:hypothetical protein GQX74_002687 [Glossina fuscipes]|nr:hypothetical protein GQX74_002687 [Glossina fuscipes]
MNKDYVFCTTSRDSMLKTLEMRSAKCLYRLEIDIREPIKYIHADEREQHYRFGRVYCGYLLALLIFTLYTTVFRKRDEEQINSIFQLDLRLQINSSTLLRGGALKD